MYETTWKTPQEGLSRLILVSENYHTERLEASPFLMGWKIHSNDNFQHGHTIIVLVAKAMAMRSGVRVIAQASHIKVHNKEYNKILTQAMQGWIQFH